MEIATECLCQHLKFFPKPKMIKQTDTQNKMDQFKNVTTEALSDAAAGILIGSGLDWAFPAPVALNSSNFLKQVLEIAGQLTASAILSVYYFRFRSKQGSQDLSRNIVYGGVALFVCQPNLQIKMSELGLGLQMFLSKGQTDFNLWDAYSGLNPSDKKAPTSQDPRSQSAFPGFTVQQGPIDDNLNSLMSQNNTRDAPVVPYNN